MAHRLLLRTLPLVAQVHGIEPFERANMKPWELHTIPSGEFAPAGAPSGRTARCVSAKRCSPPPSAPTQTRLVAADEWYERAKVATDACELQLTYETQGAKNGLDDKVRFSSFGAQRHVPGCGAPVRPTRFPDVDG